MTSAVSVQEDENAVALAGLMRVCEPPSAALAVYVGKVGAPAAWRAVCHRRAPRAVLAATAARTNDIEEKELIRRAEEDLVLAAKAGAQLIGPGDQGWPSDAVDSFQGALARGVRGAGPPIGRLPCCWGGTPSHLR